MPNYFNNTTFDRKDIDQELIDLWVSTDNPKLGEYTLTPPQPEPDPEVLAQISACADVAALTALFKSLPVDARGLHMDAFTTRKKELT